MLYKTNYILEIPAESRQARLVESLLAPQAAARAALFCEHFLSYGGSDGGGGGGKAPRRGSVAGRRRGT